MKKKLKKKILSDVRYELFRLLIGRLFYQHESLERGLLNSNVALGLAGADQYVK